MKRLSISLILLSLVVSSCENFEYSPYQTKYSELEERELNKVNIAKLQSLPKKDTLFLVFTGDHQMLYSKVRTMVNTLNSLDKLDAVFICGDLSNFGLIKEYAWLNRELKKLKSPFISVIGNHDCLKNGTEIFKKTYGPLNETFDWNTVRFVLHNTNSREFNFNGVVPDIAWMRNSMQDTANYEACIFVSHVPAYHPDFDKSLELPYAALIRSSKNPLFSMHGHNHVADSVIPYGDGITYYNTSSPKYHYYYYVKVYKNIHGKMEYQLNTFRF